MKPIDRLYQRLDRRAYLRERFANADERDLDAVLEIQRQSIAVVARCPGAIGQRIQDVLTITAGRRYMLVGVRDLVVLYIDGRAASPCSWDDAEQAIDADWWACQREVCR